LVLGSGFWVLGSGFWVLGSGFWVIGKALARHGIQELSKTPGCTLAAIALPDIHNDPFDRILVAEALERRCRIITKDSIIPTYPGISVVW